MDLGACPKSHTERLKTEFLAAKEANPNDPIFNRFQMEYESNIFTFVDDCDRRIRAAHRRLEKTPEENAKTTNLVRIPGLARIKGSDGVVFFVSFLFCSQMREIAEIELAIQGGTEKIETLGTETKFLRSELLE
jgi:hypothetical protein